MLVLRSGLYLGHARIMGTERREKFHVLEKEESISLACCPAERVRLLPVASGQEVLKPLMSQNEGKEGLLP